jgi:hypothetical protein
MGGFTKVLTGLVSVPKTPEPAPVVVEKPATLEQPVTKEVKSEDLAKEQEALKDRLRKQKGRQATSLYGSMLGGDGATNIGGLATKTLLGG